LPNGPNIEVRLRAEVQQVGGTDRLNSITVIDGKSGETDEVKASAMFIFIGASPPHTMAAAPGSKG
jgi:thioredoxin reductase (NADPH)